MLGISDAVELAKKVGDLVKTGATLGLQETVMQLREAVLNAKDEVLNLRAEVQAYKAKELEAQNRQDLEGKYPIVKAPGGAMVRKTAGPPEHYVCPKCFEDGKVYPLQDNGIAATGEHGCPGCGKDFIIDPPRKRPQIKYPTGGSGGPHGWMGR